MVVLFVGSNTGGGLRALALAQPAGDRSEAIARAAEEFDHVFGILRAPAKSLLSLPVIDDLANFCASECDSVRARVYALRVTPDTVILVQGTAARGIRHLRRGRRSKRESEGQRTDAAAADKSAGDCWDSKRMLAHIVLQQ